MQPGDLDQNEPLLEGLRELPAGAFRLPQPSGEFRDTVWQRTAGVVRGRRWRRRVIAVGGVLVAYAAGLGTAALVSIRVAAPTASRPVVAAAEPAGESLAGDLEATRDLGALSARELEEQVPLNPLSERPRLLKLAGDRYLADWGDVQGALRCYRQLLDRLPPGERTAHAPGDSWLLVTLKNARLTEAGHEGSDS